jgi:hypothetical protein
MMLLFFVSETARDFFLYNPSSCLFFSLRLCGSLFLATIQLGYLYSIQISDRTTKSLRDKDSQRPAKMMLLFFVSETARDFFLYNSSSCLFFSLRLCGSLFLAMITNPDLTF